MTDIIKEIASAVIDNIKRGFKADSDTINFIRSAYGLSDINEIASFIENGDDGGTVAGLVSYPEDSFREFIEKFIPAEGIHSDQIKSIEDQLLESEEFCSILISGRKIILSIADSQVCLKQFLKKLNLQIPLTITYPGEISEINFNINLIKAQLRKRKFIENDQNSLFLNDLIHNYSLLTNKTLSEFLSLLDISSTLLSSSEIKPLEILSEKKYFYENAIMEAEEFSLLMKTYSMEFIMMKRIQPPLISIDEARSMIRLIDRLTSIVYGMIIPSVNNVVIDGF